MKSNICHDTTISRSQLYDDQPKCNKKKPKNLQNGLISTIAMREHNLCGKIHQMTGNW